MSLFSKPKTVKQVAEDFPQQYYFLKLFLFETWSNNTGVSGPISKLNKEQLGMVTFIGQMIQYLFGEDPSDYGEANTEQIKRIKHIRKTISDDSYEVMMRSDGEFSRKIVVYSLRMKTYLHTMLDGAEWINTPQGKRTWNILQIYGSEFPEEVNDKAFNKLMKQATSTYAFNKAMTKN
ncbi:MAG: hypothetical protein ACR2KZ_08810 [Segetibacter sp.]